MDRTYPEWVTDRNEPGRRHAIQIVAARTGLSPDVIRAWERRYGAIAPERTDSRRRLFTDQDVQRLLLLRRATNAGRRIGDVAGLSVESLTELVREDERAQERAQGFGAAASGRDARHYFEMSLGAVLAFNSSELESCLHRAAIELGVGDLFEGVLSPLLEQVGERWLRGRLSIAHEHLVTSRTRAMLDSLLAAFSNPESRVRLISTTPAGQHHELGALQAAVIGAVEGWRATYLGPNLPAAEIASAAVETEASVVALSIVFPERDAALERELERLGELLPGGTHLVVGGRAAGLYRPTLEALGARVPSDLQDLRRLLTEWRDERRGG